MVAVVGGGCGGWAEIEVGWVEVGLGGWFETD